MTNPHHFAPDGNIVFGADSLRDDAFSLQREWLVTNGLGGYASSTLAGANTRRYHGLLVAALNAPVGRAVLLSRLEETLELQTADGASYRFPLSADLYPGVLTPQGHRMLISWQADPVPTWVWEPMPGLRLEKRIWQARGRNTTYISYRLLETPADSQARLTLIPLLAWKDYHSEMAACSTTIDAHWQAEAADATQSTSSLSLALPPIQRVTADPITLTLTLVDADNAPAAGVVFDAKPDWYYRFQHPREQERGQDYQEDLYTPGTLSAPLAAGSELNVIASVEPTQPDAPRTTLQTMKQTHADLLRQIEPSEALMSRLARATDAFVIQVPQGRSTLIAGYPWFSDWGRDVMISLPGLCLTTGRAPVASAILRSYADYVNDGMLPNRFPDVGETPEYNTVDATLWYFAAIYRTFEATEDLALVRDLWPTLQEIVRRHQEGTRYGIHVDPSDHLLYAGQEGMQLTWMDAKVGDWVVTPRIGKPVEINALWHNALCVMACLAGLLGDTQTKQSCEQAAQDTASAFTARFPRPDGRGLYDVLDTPGGGSDPSIRPNQIFALSLPFAPLTPNTPLAQSIIRTVQEELYTPCGLRTLSPRDPAYRPRYEGDQTQRDGAYHQGTVWPWLIGPYAEACYRVTGNRQAALSLLRPLLEQLTTYGVGSLAEVFDGSAPQRPNGCIAQAWSVGETLRVWKRLTSGV